MLRRLVICFTAALAFTACEGRPELPSIVANAQYSGDVDGAPVPPAGGPAAPDPAAAAAAAAAKLALLNTAVDKWVPATYEADVGPLLTANCTSCHNAVNKSGGADFSTADGAKLYATKIVARIRNQTMPPTAATAPAEKKASFELTANYVENWAAPASNFALKLADIQDFSYAAVIDPLNSRLCATCHTGATAKKGVLLSNEEEVKPKLDKYIAVVASGAMPPGMDQGRRDRIKALMEEWKARLSQQ